MVIHVFYHLVFSHPVGLNQPLVCKGCKGATGREGGRGGLMLELSQLLVMCKLRGTEWQNLRLHLKLGYSF